MAGYMCIHIYGRKHRRKLKLRFRESQHGWYKKGRSRITQCIYVHKARQESAWSAVTEGVFVEVADKACSDLL